MRDDYRSWLEQQNMGAKSIDTRISMASRVEKHYGSLDENHAKDRLDSVLASLRYSTDDERRSLPNPSRIPFEGNIRNNLASYRNSIELYCKFLINRSEGGADVLETDA